MTINTTQPTLQIKSTSFILICLNKFKGHIHFYYDATDSIVGFKYAGDNYTYIKNIQGDIVGILDESGNTVATYTYDAWGNILTATGDLAQINPIRYRGYYYDDEIDMYYLQSRYYDQNVGRFTNIDNLVYIGYNEKINSFDIFIYCENNPVNRNDKYGFISTSTSKISKNKIKITINFTKKDTNNISKGISIASTLTTLILDTIGGIGGLPTYGISAEVALLVSQIIQVLEYNVTRYIDKHHNGAKIEIWIKYGYTTLSYPVYKVNKWGYLYFSHWEKIKIPYVYLYKLPKFSWNK